MNVGDYVELESLYSGVCARSFHELAAVLGTFVSASCKF